MKRIFTLVLILFISASSFSQNYLKFQDEPSIELLQSTACKLDSSAHAAVILDSGYGVVDLSRSYDNLTIFYERIIRIKIYSSEGFDQANFSINYYDDEMVEKIKAITYNYENGKVVETKLDDENVYREEVAEDYYAKKFALPNVKVGSVIDVYYRISSPYIANIKPWNFQRKIPTLYSSYVLSTPDWFAFRTFSRGYGQLKNILKESKPTRIGNQLFEQRKSTYIAENIIAFPKEKYIPSADSYLFGIDFDLTAIAFPGEPVKNYATTWIGINKEYYDAKNGGAKFEPGKKERKIIELLNLDSLSNIEKAKKIYSYTIENFSWNEKYSKYSKSDTDDIIKQRGGNSGEINLLYLRLCKQAGLTAYPVLISTLDNGMVNEIKTDINIFNTCIIMLEFEGKEQLVDATDKDTPFGMLPNNDINQKGLAMVEPIYCKWIEIPNNEYTNLKMINVDLSDKVGLTGKYSERKVGVPMVNFIKKKNTNSEDKIIEGFENQFGDAFVEDFKYTQNDKTLTLSFNFNIEEFVAFNKSIISFKPLLGEKNSNPFKSKTRELPVIFNNTFSETVIFQYKIPEGYSLDKKPENLILSLPNRDAIYSFTCNQMQDGLVIQTSLKLQKQVFNQDEYELLKIFFEQIASKENEEIFFKKI